ncbi:hypothetical protein GH714_028031 [Hevea brasiliensis]|uniref:C3H1-type domain-containing protein n=1 Tax=Hevea brasiliensis TaxID=3981 RepID=A0A6A6MEH8_HEVBR|nr:hypothetical protein GH714_028031 [Hevea brasiliensis]
MGYILLQDLTDKDLLSLAFASQTLLQNVIVKAKTHLGLPTNALSTPSAPSSPLHLNPISRPSNNHNPFSQYSAKANSLIDFAKNPSPHAWHASSLTNQCAAASISPKSSPFLSYDSIRAGFDLVGNGSGDTSSNSTNLLNENQSDEYFSFLDDFSPQNEEFVDPRFQLCGLTMNNVDNHLRRRRFSESDVCFGIEDGVFGIGHRPCMYFAKGFCKNGDNCKFVHASFDGDNISEFSDGGATGSSLGETNGLYLQQYEEMMRIKAAQQQQSLSYSKYMNFLLQQQSDPHRMAAASVMMGDEFHKFGQFCSERNDLLAMAMEEKANSASRQIYLTFPADSTFKDEDVSNYFSAFGTVQDVRIPYQQKRMFGFVTFVHPETVKLILSRGNPHFICYSRVLVKPYKEKGKIANKRQQLMDRGDFSPCSSPSGLDSRELCDLHLGARMLYNTQEMKLRRKLEQQAQLQQAIELQERRLINLQLPCVRGDYIHHQQRSLSAGALITLPPHASVNNLTSDVKNQDVLDDKGDSSATDIGCTIVVAEQHLQDEVSTACVQKKDTANGEERLNPEGCDTNECCGTVIEHGLPDSPFASTAKSLGNQDEFSPPLTEVKESIEFTGTSSSEITASVPTTSTSDVASIDNVKC